MYITEHLVMIKVVVKTMMMIIIACPRAQHRLSSIAHPHPYCHASHYCILLKIDDRTSETTFSKNIGLKQWV